MDRATATRNLTALLEVYATVQQPLSIGYFEHGDGELVVAGTPQIAVGNTICHGMPSRYLRYSPRTVMNTAVLWELLESGKTAEEVVTAALDMFPVWTMPEEK